MTKQGTILVVDDNKGILAAVQLLLGTCFEQVITLSNPNQILNTLRENPVDLVLLDMNFSAGINNGNEGLFWLSEIHKTDASIPVVLFTAYADIDLAVRGIKEGAFDFVVKPWDNAKLLETLRNAYSAGKTDRRDNGYPNKQPTGESGMYWGTSERMTQLRALITKVALTDANLLITGENGTGKETGQNFVRAGGGQRTAERRGARRSVRGVPAGHRGPLAGPPVFRPGDFYCEGGRFPEGGHGGRSAPGGPPGGGRVSEAEHPLGQAVAEPARSGVRGGGGFGGQPVLVRGPGAVTCVPV